MLDVLSGLFLMGLFGAIVYYGHIVAQMLFVPAKPKKIEDDRNTVRIKLGKEEMKRFVVLAGSNIFEDTPANWKAYFEAMDSSRHYLWEEPMVVPQTVKERNAKLQREVKRISAEGERERMRTAKANGMARLKPTSPSPTFSSRH